MRKKTGIAISALCGLGLTVGCGLGAVKNEKAIIPKETVTYLNLKAVPLSGDKDEWMKIYLAMRQQGQKEGYTPVVVLDELSMAEDAEKEEGSLEAYTKKCLEAYPKIEIDQWLKERNNDYQTYQMDVESSRKGENIDELEEDREPMMTIEMGYAENAYIVKVPTKKPYEVFAYLPVGGYNECPLDEEHIALAKRWYEIYGAVPCAISSDTVQYYVEKPIETKNQTLANEMYLYCGDIVWQGVQCLENLEKANQGAAVWFFWWD